jgi:hypothetical protein
MEYTIFTRHRLLRFLLVLMALISSAECEAAYYNMGFFQMLQVLDASWTPQWASLAGYWNFDGALGAIASAATIPATTGACVGTTTSTGMSYVTGQVHQGISSNGGGVALRMAAACAPNPGTTMTVAFWFKSSSPTANYWGSYITKTDATTAGWAISKDNSSSGTMYMRIDTSGGINQGTSGFGGMFDGNWHHIAWILNSGNYVAYLDGASAVSGTYTAGTGFAKATIPMDVGNVTGSYDDVAIWSVALSASDILKLYKHQKPAGP